MQLEILGYETYHDTFQLYDIIIENNRYTLTEYEI